MLTAAVSDCSGRGGLVPGSGSGSLSDSAATRSTVCMASPACAHPKATPTATIPLVSHLKLLDSIGRNAPLDAATGVYTTDVLRGTTSGILWICCTDASVYPSGTVGFTTSGLPSSFTSSFKPASEPLPASATSLNSVVVPTTTTAGVYKYQVNFAPSVGPAVTAQAAIRAIQDDITSVNLSTQKITATLAPTGTSGPFQVFLFGTLLKGPVNFIATPVTPMVASGGTQTVTLHCLEHVGGTFTSTAGEWTLKDDNGTQTFSGPHTAISLTIPSKTLLSNLVSTAPAGYQNALMVALPMMLEAFAETSLTTDQIAAGLAQIAIESNYQTQMEIISYSKAEQNYNYPGNPLGNTNPGDGYNYRGAGLIQLTGKYNYGVYGKDIGVDLVNNPAAAASPANAYEIAAYYLAANLAGAVGGKTTGLSAQDFRNERQAVDPGESDPDTLNLSQNLGLGFQKFTGGC